MAWMEELRREYAGTPLCEEKVPTDPITLFDQWFRQAIEVSQDQWSEPNSMVLATVDADGRPDARVVLLKDFGPQGFSFFTSYASRKGEQLQANPSAALVFYWGDLLRQVRVLGAVQKVDLDTSRAYFASRPPSSQLGSAASDQSQIISGRDVLDRRLKELQRQYGRRPVPMPESWGGYICRPREVEFWQGRPNRLHDRLRYRLVASGSWIIERLAP